MKLFKAKEIQKKWYNQDKANNRNKLKGLSH